MNDRALLWNHTLHKRIYFGFLALIALADLLGFFFMQGDSNFARGISVYSPQNDQVIHSRFTVDGAAYAVAGVTELQVIAVNQSGEEFRFPFQRHEIKYHGNTLLQLASYTAQVELPQDGEYVLKARMETALGEAVDSVAVHIRVDPKSASPQFKMFSPAHYLSLAALFLFALLIILWARRGSENSRQLGKIIIACAIMLFELGIMYNLVLQRNFRISYDLPLHMCSISILLVPVLLLTENKRWREFLYHLLFLWGLGGAIQALLTPDLSIYPFLGIHYVCFFVTHGMIAVAVLYLTYTEGYRPSWRRFPKVLLASAVCGGFAYGVCHLVKLLPPYEAGGYFILAYPPVSGSIIDYLVEIFGPSPYYILGLLLLFPIFQGVLTLPIWLGDRIANRRKPQSVAAIDPKQAGL